MQWLIKVTERRLLLLLLLLQIGMLQVWRLEMQRLCGRIERGRVLLLLQRRKLERQLTTAMICIGRHRRHH